MKQLISDEEITALDCVAMDEFDYIIDESVTKFARAIEKLATERALRLAAEMCGSMSWQGRNEISIAKDDAADECRDAILNLLKEE